MLETLAGRPRAAFSLISAAPVAAGISLRYKDWSELAGGLRADYRVGNL